MKFFIYYDLDLMYSFLAQNLNEEIPIEFFIVTRENRCEENNRYCIEPRKELEKCCISAHYSNNDFCGLRREYSFINLDEVRIIKRNKFLYKYLNKIEKCIFNSKNCTGFYHSKKSNKKNVKVLYDKDKFLINDDEILKLASDNKIIYGYRINDTLVKPICVYIKF